MKLKDKFTELMHNQALKQNYMSSYSKLTHLPGSYSTLP